MGTLRPPYQQKYFFRPIEVPFYFITQTQSDQNPHTKSAIFSTLGITFLLIGGDRKDILPFLDARDPYPSNGTNAVLSISLEKKSTFFVRHFSSVALYMYVRLLLEFGGFTGPRQLHVLSEPLGASLIMP